MNFGKVLALPTAAGLLLGSAAGAYAADNSAAANSDQAGASGEIIVTAQRRSESLQKTPVAVSVISADALRERAVVSEADLQSVSPGVTVRAGQNSNQLNYAIRGQSLDPFSNTRPGVVPYINEVQIGGDGGSTAFYDLQSIQVLKGPQGTLFGRNATGGAILFTTTRPKEEFGGYVSGRLGNYDARQIEGAINVPLAEGAILTRVAGFYEKRDGYQYDLFKGKRVGDVDRFGLRGSITIKPSDNIKNELVIDYLHSNGSNLTNVIDSLYAPGAVPIIALTNFGDQAGFNGLINAFTGGAANCGVGTGQVNCAAAYAAAHPNLDPKGIASYLNTQKERGPYKIESDGPNAYRGRNTIVSNITTFDIADDLQIKNVFGYTHLNTSIYGDIDGIPWGIDDNGDLGKLDRTRQFSDELQLVGKAFDKNLSYVVGVFFSKERKVQKIGTYLFRDMPIYSVQPAAGKTRNNTLAFYGQGTYDLSDATGIQGLGITAGLRYTREKVKYNVLPLDQYYHISNPDFVYDQSKSYKNVSWTFGIQEQVNENFLIYAASRRSYRNGGYNVIAAPIEGLGSVNGGNGYDVEKLTDAELGMKYRGGIGGTPVLLNVALYKNWIKNNQRVAYTLLRGAPAAVAVNVPEAQVKGFEIDGQIQPAQWLKIGGALNYTDGKFTDNEARIAGGTVPVVFGTYPDTPKWSGSVFGEIEVPVSADISAKFRTDYYAQSMFYYTSTANNNPNAKISGYDLVDFRIGLEDERNGWSLSANLKNAFKKTYYVGGIATGELFQFNTVVPGAPRTFLVEARYNF